MIQSMTGYGKATVTFGDKKINVEIKSLNSKALDLSTRIAPLYREKEMEIRNRIAKTLERGKVDFSLWIEKEAGESATLGLKKKLANLLRLSMPHWWKIITNKSMPLLRLITFRCRKTGLPHCSVCPMC